MARSRTQVSRRIGAWAIAALSALGALGEKDAPGAPALRNVELRADLGAIPAGAARLHVFHFESPWEESVEVRATKVACGACTRVAEWPASIEPGVLHRVGVEIRPGRERGPHTYRATLVGANGRLVTCTLTARVTGMRTVPGEATLGELSADETRRRAVRVEYYRPADLAHEPALRIAAMGAPFRATIVGPVTPDGELDRSAWTVVVELRGRDLEAAGPARGTLAFEIINGESGDVLDRAELVVHAVRRDGGAVAASAAEVALAEVMADVRAFPGRRGRAMTRAELWSAAQRADLRTGDQSELMRRQRALIAAWESTRGPLPIAATTLGELIAWKRDSLRAVDATVRLRITVDHERAPAGFADAFPGATEYVIRQAFWGERRHLDIRSAEDGRLAARRTFDGVLEGAIDLESGVGWIGPPDALESYLDPVEPWPAVAGLIGDRRLGLARSRESDLAALLLHDDAGSATIVPHLRRVDGAPCVVVEYGWPEPLEVCLDPALTYAPRSMRERMEVDAGALVEVTTRWSDFDEVLDGVWLAQRVERRQAPIGADGSVERPYLIIELTAERVALNRPVATCFDVAALFPPDARVVDRRTGTVIAGAEAGRAVAAARAALEATGAREAAP